jgi:hypothetical protein
MEGRGEGGREKGREKISRVRLRVLPALLLRIQRQRLGVSHSVLTVPSRGQSGMWGTCSCLWMNGHDSH